MIRHLSVMKTIFISTLLIAVPCLASEKFTLPNIPWPTYGGKQVWQDERVYADWRMQKNVLTHHYRLLDNRDIRRAWGNYRQTRSAFEQFIREKNLRPVSPDMVMLIHGITPVRNPFGHIEPTLKKWGYDVVAISYPSTRKSIQEHATALAELINRLKGTKRIHFVTHSMGALILRHVIAKKEQHSIKQDIGSIIMLAPPNQGAGLARMLKKVPVFQLIYGPAGQDLTPSHTNSIPLISEPFIIIAGGKGDGKGYNPLIKGDDDGTISVSETYLPGATKTYTLPELHTSIGYNKKSIKIILEKINSAPPLQEVEQ